jgi:MraZ protein
VELDKVGRLNLPKKLLERAGIGAEALFVGCGDRIEVWSEAAFEEALALESDLIPEDLRVPPLTRGEKGK